jgi:AAA domain
MRWPSRIKRPRTRLRVTEKPGRNVALIARAPPRKLNLIRFGDIRPRLDGCPLIKGVLEREQVSVIFGEAGCGKTFLMLDAALHIAAGLEWCGRAVAGGAVAYIAAEAGPGIENRVAAWKIVHTAKIGKGDIPFVAVTSPVDLCHANAGDVERLIEAARDSYPESPALIVIDTVSRALAGGNENAPDDMGGFVRSLDSIRDALHCHVAAVHHAGKDTSKGSRGHSLLHCAVDTEIEVTRAASGISTATVTKQRDLPIDGQISFRLVPVELGRNDDGDPVTSCTIDHVDNFNVPTKPGKLPDTARLALSQLQNCIADHAEKLPSSAHVPAGGLGVTLDLWKRYLLSAGLINQDGNPRQQFKRIRVTLQDRGFVGVWAISYGCHMPSHSVTVTGCDASRHVTHPVGV